MAEVISYPSNLAGRNVWASFLFFENNLSIHGHKYKMIGRLGFYYQKLQGEMSRQFKGIINDSLIFFNTSFLKVYTAAECHKIAMICDVSPLVYMGL